jgi:hypothetical protein
MLGAINHRKPKNRSITIKVVLKIMTIIFNKDELKKNDVFGYGPIDIKIKILNKIIFMLQCKIIVLLSLCYP